MNIFILKLEPYDDIISVREKMNWGKMRRILIVWPKHAHVLNRRLDLLLLKRHSERLGVNLALVTDDPDIRYLAPCLGIQVFNSIQKAKTKKWRPPRQALKAHPKGMDYREKNSSDQEQEKYQVRKNLIPPKPISNNSSLSPIALFIFSAMGVLAVLLFAIILFPSADILLYPKIKTQELKTKIRVNPEITSSNQAGEIPAYKVSTIVENSETLPVSGSINIPFQQAEGNVRFMNLTDQAITIPEGTIVHTTEPEVVRFSVTQAGEIPAGSGETLSLPIRAVLMGSHGNQPTNSIVSIEGSLGTQLSVANLSPLRGGSDHQVQAPSDADREQLFNQLRNNLQATALIKMRSILSPGDLLVPNSLTLYKIIEEEYQPSENHPADYLIHKQRLEFQALVVKLDDLHSFSTDAFDTDLPEGYDPVNGSLVIEKVKELANEDESSILWTIHATRVLHSQLSEPKAIQLALGETPSVVINNLARTFELDAPPEIILKPFWWPRMPLMPFRIRVVNQGTG